MTVSEGNRPPPTIFERFPKLKEIPEGGFPQNILIIPDGNRRFARLNNQNPLQGHIEGTKVTLDILRDLRDLPIPFVSLWGFSSDNVKRPKDEVEGLMTLFENTIQENIDELKQENARFIHLGNRRILTSSLLSTIDNAEEQTKNNSGQTLVMLLGFGGRDQEIRQAKRLRDILFMIPETQVTDELWESLRDGKGLVPPAKLIIRTSGEMRTSNIGWIGADAEFYSIRELFPEIGTEHIVNGIVDFSHRQLRMGA